MNKTQMNRTITPTVTRPMTNKTFVIAEKEVKDALRNNAFLVLLLLLTGLIIVSIIVSTLVFRSQVDQYQAALEILKSLGKEPTTAAPQLFPLNLLRGTVDYLEIIGALLAMVLGYLSVAKEKNTKTLSLVLTRPVSKTQVMMGKLLGNYLLILGLTLAIGLIIWLALLLIGSVALGGVEWIKLLLVVLLASFYLMAFFTLSFFLSLSQKNIVNGLVISFLIWLTFVLILPQIGDTMDPDNQVPGGFFASLTLDRPQEKELMKKFNGYESIRTGLEQLSITKHFERAAFALFGIKKQYNEIPLAQILAEKTYDFIFVITLLVFGGVANTLLFRRRNDYLW
jgi:ABC-type transport system involved in multi-copper enzyme maturation permease subunit